MVALNFVDPIWTLGHPAIFQSINTKLFSSRFSILLIAITYTILRTIFRNLLILQIGIFYEIFTCWSMKLYSRWASQDRCSCWHFSLCRFDSMRLLWIYLSIIPQVPCRERLATHLTLIWSIVTMCNLAKLFNWP